MTDREALRPDLQLIVDKIRALQAYTRRTGFRTTRSQGEILSKLSPDDLALVAMSLESSS